MQLSWVSRAPRSSVSVSRGTTKGLNTLNTVVHARKHAEKKATPAITADDEASEVLPADLDKLRQLNKGELQRELDVRGLDRQGDKLELANRLLDNLIAQESALQPNNGTNELAETPSDTTTAPARRGRRTSRKATTALEPTADGHTPAAAAAAPEIPAASPAAADTAAMSTAAADPAAAAPTSRRGRKTSRRVSSVLSGQQEEDSHTKSAAEPELQRPEAEEAAITATAETSASTASRRARRTSRKTTTVDPASEEASIAPAADVAAVVSNGSSSKRARRTSRASSVVEPAEAAMTPAAGDAPALPVRGRRVGRKSSTVEPAEPVAPPAASAQPAAAEVAPVASTGRGRRTSHKSSVIDSLEPTPIAAPDAIAAEPARRPRARSSAKTTSTGPVADATPAAAVDGSSRSSAAAGNGSSSSRAKLLAQELAKKVMTTPTVAATTAAITPVAAAAVAPEAVAAAAAPEIPAAGEDTDSWAYDQLYAGSQAQSDSLIMAGGRGTESSDDNWSATYEEVLAQVAAEEAAGLADEAQVLDTTTVDSMVAAAMAAAVPNLADIAAAGDAVIPGQQLMPSLVEGALIAEKTQPDDALSAFDKLSVECPAAAAGAAELAVVGVLQHQQPDLSDISAAVIEGGDESPLEEDEAADEVLSAFDHVVVDPPVHQLSSQDPSVDDIAAAMSVIDPADSPLGEDEEPDVALTAFDHMVISAPTAQPAEQHPNMTDIAAVITQEPAAVNDEVLGEDEEADEALTAFDHISFAAPDAAVTDEAATATVAVPVTVVSNSFVGGSSSSDADGFAGHIKGWVAAVMKMFEDWQKSLAPK